MIRSQEMIEKSKYYNNKMGDQSLQKLESGEII